MGLNLVVGDPIVPNHGLVVNCVSNLHLTTSARSLKLKSLFLNGKWEIFRRIDLSALRLTPSLLLSLVCIDLYSVEEFKSQLHGASDVDGLPFNRRIAHKSLPLFCYICIVVA